MSVAAHRFNNDLRYRDGEHIAQTAFTPSYVLDPVREALDGIELDPCTTPDNPTGATRWIAPPGDGLRESWDASSIFVNPPYGKAREQWVLRCIDAAYAGSRVILLMPAHPDTRIFQRAVGSALELCFIKGRVKFGIPRENGRQVASSHPSVLIAWNASLDPCRHLGVIVRAS